MREKSGKMTALGEVREIARLNALWELPLHSEMPSEEYCDGIEVEDGGDE